MVSREAVTIGPKQFVWDFSPVEVFWIPIIFCPVMLAKLHLSFILNVAVMPLWVRLRTLFAGPKINGFLVFHRIVKLTGTPSLYVLFLLDRLVYGFCPVERPSCHLMMSVLPSNDQ